MQRLIIEGTKLIRDDLGLLSNVVLVILILQIVILCKLFF